MTELQAIVRIENAIWRATADDMGTAHIPASMLTNEQWEALSKAAWNEMKAIAREDPSKMDLTWLRCDPSGDHLASSTVLRWTV